MDPLAPLLSAAALFCSLVAGFLFAFAVVVMPGIARLPDRDFLRAFKEMDGVIQRNSPAFLAVWLGSAAAVVVASIFAWAHEAAMVRWGTTAAMIAYLIGVQLPTIMVHIPLNNQLQSLDLDTQVEDSLGAARERFEPRWNRWNVVRTWAACLVAAWLLRLLLLI